MPNILSDSLVDRAALLGDSIACDSVGGNFVTSGFDGIINPVPLLTHDVLMGWNLIILGLVLLLIVLNKQLYPRQFRQALTVPGGVAHTNQLLREWSPLKSFLGIAFFIAYVVVMALFVQKACVVLSRDVIQYNDFRVFGVILGIVAAWVILRLVILFIMNWLFQTRDAADRQVTVQLSVSLLCLLLIQPVLWLILYYPYSAFVWTGLGIIGLAALMRLILEIIETRVSTKLPVFYIFLYFCALEIIPGVFLLTAGLRYFAHGSVF